MERFYLSQSCLKSWETDCPKAFHAKWFGTEIERQSFDVDKEVFRRGVVFETLCLGAGLGGKQGKRSDVTAGMYTRISEQAGIYKDWEKANGFTRIAIQHYIRIKIEWSGGVYYASGNIDNLCRDRAKWLTIIDTKLTAKRESTWGIFQFGNPYKVDTTQLQHYSMLAKTAYGEDTRQMYYVADSQKDFGSKVLEYRFADWMQHAHHERCQNAYNTIVTNLALGYWPAKPSADKCTTCPLRFSCDDYRRIPDIEVIELT